MKRSVAILAYALQDSESTSKMADLCEEDRARYFERAETLFRWLNIYGMTIVRKRRKEA